jgi:hypothetical protein
MAVVSNIDLIGKVKNFVISDKSGFTLKRLFAMIVCGTGDP